MQLPATTVKFNSSQTFNVSFYQLGTLTGMINMATKNIYIDSDIISQNAINRIFLHECWHGFDNLWGDIFPLATQETDIGNINGFVDRVIVDNSYAILMNTYTKSNMESDMSSNGINCNNTQKAWDALQYFRTNNNSTLCYINWFYNMYPNLR